LTSAMVWSAFLMLFWILVNRCGALNGLADCSDIALLLGLSTPVCSLQTTSAEFKTWSQAQNTNCLADEVNRGSYRDVRISMAASLYLCQYICRLCILKKTQPFKICSTLVEAPQFALFSLSL
jgi:hypothetical protein